MLFFYVFSHKKNIKIFFIFKRNHDKLHELQYKLKERQAASDPKGKYIFMF